eukprot:TRINITY_DN13884_c0_g1_i1.p1 TRINITY_DN13884_c0_g1~~TRINITY_DN13884_c0_g1_i1.p1  ORF type:complete len:527 (+),score=81.47 TRINITY_DN13884_c0_g1_i1:31-1611(+)
MNRGLVGCLLLLSMIVGFSHAFGFSKHTSIVSPIADEGVQLMVDIGDVNGDKINDFTIQKSSDDGLYVVLGSTNLTNQASISISNTSMLYFTFGTNAARFAWGVSDLDKDGYDDFIIASSDLNCYLVYGKANFPAETDLTTLTNPAISVITLYPYAVATADLNKDGHRDIAFADTNTGTVIVVFGGSSRLPSTLNITALPAGQKMTISGLPVYRTIRLNNVGDVNNDGYDDLIIGCASFTYNSYANGGGAVIYSGSAVTDLDLSNLSSRGITLYCSDNSTLAGKYGQRVKDFNGDGYQDFVVLSYYNTGSNNSGFVIFGNNSLPNVLDVCNLPAGAGMTIIAEADYFFDNFNTESGDFNQDGFTDIIAGVPRPNKVYILFGSANPPSVFHIATDNPFVIDGANYLSGTDNYFGYSVLAADFNGDGNLDAGIRSRFVSFVFFGDAPSPSISTSVTFSPSNSLSSSTSVRPSVPTKPPKTKTPSKKKTPIKNTPTPTHKSSGSTVTVSLMAVLGLSVAPLMRFLFVSP